MFRQLLGQYMALAPRKTRSMLELKKIIFFFNFSFFCKIFIFFITNGYGWLEYNLYTPKNLFI